MRVLLAAVTLTLCGAVVIAFDRIPNYVQWVRLLAPRNELRAFLEENKGKLKLKDEIANAASVCCGGSRSAFSFARKESVSDSA